MIGSREDLCDATESTEANLVIGTQGEGMTAETDLLKVYDERPEGQGSALKRIFFNSNLLHLVNGSGLL